QAVEKIHEALKGTQTAAKEPIPPPPQTAFLIKDNEPLTQKLQIVSRLIQKGLGTRLFYVAIDGFDTHSDQAESQAKLLGEVGGAIEAFFQSLQGAAKRVLLMTYSEFGRPVQENGSRGTDHGAASCLFVAGPAVKPGPLGKYPSLGELDDG